MTRAWMEKNRKIVVGMVIFMMALAIVGVLMQSKMKTLLNYYVEQQAVRQAQLLAEMTEKQFAAQLQQLEWTADYLQDNDEDRQAIVGTFAGHEEHVSVGLLEMDGNAVCGEELDFLAFDGIRQSFRGNDAVSYSKEQGLLFTVPVYRGRNVRYVLYKLYDVSILSDRFGLSCYEGRGRALVVDMQEQVVIPGGGSVEEDVRFLQQPEIHKGILTMWEEQQVLTAASEYVKSEEDDYFLFCSDIADTDMLLIGYVPENVATEGIAYLIVLVLWVFGLLFAVFVAGMVYLFGAEEKVKEGDELREAKLIADKANRAKSDFLANISHEIRTPINAVMGMNEMILRECEQEEIREYAQNIQGASQTLLSLINDILDFSKIESGKMEIVEDVYDVASMLNDVINMVRVKAEDKGLWFRLNIDEKLPCEMWGDPIRTRQIAINILNNAVKYTKEGGVTFTVTGEHTAEDRILLKIQVSDTGIGIKEEDMPKLFNNFERVNLGENRNVEGTGLGLAITQKLTEQMNGVIEVQSEYGAGSTFTLYLPQGVVNNSPLGDFQKRYQVVAQQSRQQYRESFLAPEAEILVVDDTAMNLLVITQLLKKTQVKVDTCASGRECLELICKKHYDVILLDHMMPDMDGIETLEEMMLMNEHCCHGTPVIALTANAIVGVREMYIEKGFDDYLSKPVEGKDLEDMLKKYIPSQKLQIIEEQQIPGISAAIGVSGQSAAKDAAKKNDAENTTLPVKKAIVDTELGIRYCGESEDVYREVLREFCDVEPEERRKIEEAYAGEDWKNYAILVHGLKSASLSIGAKKLSEEAAGIEKASEELTRDEAPHKKELLKFIREYHGKTMEMYEDSAEEGAQYLSQYPDE